MKKKTIEDQTFDRKDYSATQLEAQQYELCTFSSCNFSGANLSHLTFEECTFNDCDLSLAKLNLTSFKDVKFVNCKMLGLDFSHCKDWLLSFTFESCNLELSTFVGMELKGLILKECLLQEVDWSEANLTAVQFDKCDLNRAIFENTNLEKADFTTAYGYSFDPEKNKIKQAKFSTNGLAGLLKKYDLVID